jgi:hypothetical protein
MHIKKTANAFTVNGLGQKVNHGSAAVAQQLGSQ